MDDFFVFFRIISGLNEPLHESGEQFSSDRGFDVSKGLFVFVLEGSEIFLGLFDFLLIFFLFLVLLLGEVYLLVLDVGLKFV